MSSHEPLATICVPTIGRDDYWLPLQQAVDAQTLRDVEVLILDNASPAAARERFEAWARRDQRVRVLRVEPRIPMFENFNRGIAAARGRFLVFFHDDDVYRPRILERCVEVMDRNPRVSFCGSNYDFVDEAGRVTEERRWIPADRAAPGREYIADLLGRGRNMIPMPGLVYRRSAIAGGFDCDLPIHFGDFVLLARLAEEGDVGLIEEPLMAVRRHAEQASVGLPMSRALSLRTRVLLDYCDEYVGRHPGERDFIDRLRRRIAVSHRLGLTWAWATAPRREEADACAEALGTSGLDAAARSLLQSVDRIGLRDSGIRRVGRWMPRIAPWLKL